MSFEKTRRGLGSKQYTEKFIPKSLHLPFNLFICQTRVLEVGAGMLVSVVLAASDSADGANLRRHALLCSYKHQISKSLQEASEVSCLSIIQKRYKHVREGRNIDVG
jgi:hypothetical protein